MSAVLEIGAFLPWASSTKRIIRARVVSSPVRVTCTYSAPLRLTLPPITSTVRCMYRLHEMCIRDRLGELQRAGERYALPGFQVRLTRRQSTIRETLLALCEKSSAKAVKSEEMCIRDSVSPPH